VVTVQLGEPVTFTCVLPDGGDSARKLKWYKQRAGDTPKLIVILRKGMNPVHGPGFSAQKLSAVFDEKKSSLTIVRTSKEDEGMYLCAVTDWTEDIWSGTYLSLKGNHVF